MKSLLAGLLIFTALGSARAASTETFIVSQEVGLDGITYIRPVKVPVEQKVVEIHMATKAAEIQEAVKRRGKITTLPLGRGTCSGEFIDSDGDILTARHCVDGFDSFDVQTSDQRHFTATVIATSTVHDLALIHIDRRNTPFFELAETATRGETIYVLGSPLGITDTLSTGVIAKIGGDETLIDCAALPGNSGGPVFNRDQKLVGVLTAGFIVLFGTTHLNMAQGVDAVQYFLVEALEKKNYGR